MKKLAFVLLFGVVAAAPGCDKPSGPDCRQAIMKIRMLTGTDKMEGATDVEAAVRSCRGNASKKSVKCAMEASSLEQLERCGLIDADEINGLEGSGARPGTGTGTDTK